MLSPTLRMIQYSLPLQCIYSPLQCFPLEAFFFLFSLYFINENFIETSGQYTCEEICLVPKMCNFSQ